MRKHSMVIILFVIVFLLSACTPSPAPEPGAPEQPDAPVPDDAPLDCDWTLHVDQTIPIESDGMTVNYTLVLIAQKIGGTDVYGTYEGAAYIGTSLDASNLSNAFIDVTGGFDMHAFANNLSFELVPYDIEAYSRYDVGEGEAPIAPLVSYESMALISPEMTGGGVLNPNVTDIQGMNMGYEAEAFGTEAVTMKITVNSGMVQVVVPSFNISHSFEGRLLGDPGTLYEDAMDKIEELTENSGDDADSGDGDFMGGLGDIMGEGGQNLALPEGFAVGDFPLMDDANIFNVFQNEDNKTVRIMYGTKKAYDDVIAFYQPVFDKIKGSAIPIDDGVMYMGDMSGYRTVTFMVTEDSSGTFGIIVYIEYSK